MFQVATIYERNEIIEGHEYILGFVCDGWRIFGLADQIGDMVELLGYDIERRRGA